MPLETIGRCFQGVIPSWLVTCSADGVPNVTILSIVHYVDEERVALTRQFFNKTSANLDANPQAQVVVVDPLTSDQFLLDLRFLHTETEGATFDAVAANLDAVASQMGMQGVFRLRGVDIHRVLSCAPLGETLRAAPQRSSEQRTLAGLEEYVRRLAGCADYSEATRVGLTSLEDLFGFGHSILLVADQLGDRLFAVASNGYGEVRGRRGSADRRRRDRDRRPPSPGGVHSESCPQPRYARRDRRERAAERRGVAGPRDPAAGPRGVAQRGRGAAGRAQSAVRSAVSRERPRR